MKISLLLTVLFLSFSCFGQIIPFEKHTILDNQYQTFGISYVQSADIDGDGDLDIIGASNQGIIWLEQTDTGFEHARKIIKSSKKNFDYVISVDLDNDGDLDLISTSNFNPTLRLYLNQGNGVFDEPIILTSDIYSPIHPKIRDIDEDGDLDIIFIKETSKQIIQLENTDGKVEFIEKKLLDLDTNLKDFELQDVDQNGHLDFITASSSGNLKWYKNTGNTQFQSPVLLAKYESIKKLAVKDLDDDGNLDFIVNTSIGCYTQKKIPSGISPPERLISDNSRTYFNIVHDMDGDGDLDILNQLGWYENIDGNGNFSDLKVIDGLYTTSTNHLSIGDLDHNGVVDILSCNKDNNSISWFKGLGNGNFAPRTFFSKDIVNGLKGFQIADIDGDDDLDIISASANDRKVAWYENLDGNGTYSAQKVISSNIPSSSDVRIIDLDGDGDSDILAYSPLAWFENIDGQGHFSKAKNINNNLLGQIYDLVTGDFDNDGDIDFIASTNNLDNLTFFINDGQTNFQTADITNSFFTTAKLHALDVNNNGFLDIIATQNNKVFFIKNTGNSTYFEKSLLLDEKVKNIKFSDLDKDGDIDLLVGALNTNNYFWYENTGNGGFTKKEKLFSSNKSVYLVDLDADNDDDIILTHKDNDEIQWLENKNGKFSKESTISIIDFNINQFKFADINEDGHIDIISSSHSNQLSWHQNQGLEYLPTDSIGFQDRLIINKDIVNPNAIFPIDVDNDGDLDVIFNSKNFCAWMENTDGKGDFSIKHEINVNVNSIQPIDFDMDGDIDILSNVGWFENDGNGKFKKQVLYTGWSDFHAIGDIDKDGDLDIVAIQDSTFTLFDNDGQQNFHSIQQTKLYKSNSLYSLKKVFLIDLDNDGYLDLIFNYSGFNLESFDELNWVENNNGAFNFSQKSDIYYGSSLVQIYPTDLDTDGDLDIVLLNNVPEVRFNKNNGNGYFNKSRLNNSSDLSFVNAFLAANIDSNQSLDAVFGGDHITWARNNIMRFNDQFPVSRLGATHLAKGDIDNDGDIDIVSCSSYDNHIYWHQNLSELIDQTTEAITQNMNFTIVPNPSSGIFTIQSSSEISKIEIYNRLGQLVSVNQHQNHIDISRLNDGLYFCKILDSNGQFGVREIIKK